MRIPSYVQPLLAMWAASCGSKTTLRKWTVQLSSGTNSQNLYLQHFFTLHGTSHMIYSLLRRRYDVKVRVSTDGADLTGTIKTRAESETQLPTATKSYYVSPSGTVSSCTDQSPCPLATALASVKGGEEVVLKDGVYYVGEIALNKVVSNYIVIRGSRQGKAHYFKLLTCDIYTSVAILDGSDSATFTWTNEGGTVYKTTVAVPDTQVVVANGKRLFKHTTLTGLQTLNKKSPGFYTTGTDLYVNLNGMPYV